MKKIEIITRTEKLEIIKKILVNHNCLGLTVYSVMGCGRQKGHISKAENDDVATNLLPKIYVMTVVKDSELKLIMNDIYNEIGTGTHGDGKVFVSNIEDARRKCFVSSKRGNYEREKSNSVLKRHIKNI